MRLKLTLFSQDEFFPLNYNYYLSSAIYKLLKFGSEEFSNFLHDKGFQLKGKKYKLFTFALRFNQLLINSTNIRLLSNEATLFISSPLIDDFIRNFIIGTFEQQSIEIADGTNKCKFLINQVEAIPQPEFQEINHFKMLSPMVLSTVEENGNKTHQHYFRYNDKIDEINRVFNQNLKNKYKLIYDKEYSEDDLILVWDENYINKKLNEKKRLTKKISVIKNHEEPIEIIANEIPFTLSGNSELIKVGYECGFGEKNSIGFGMAGML
ncbi:MAG: CRISPR-associated endoribonuclease Cas6 [Ignavibacteriales bacterium CG_4_9_14_3_um_filter_34_10]|nr:MAG: CRISPR-associated endoribonuclease Cas6 [Ignavibacteriales bacterium CG_4_9_14_3_um_filter_34_10]